MQPFTSEKSWGEQRQILLRVPTGPMRPGASTRIGSGTRTRIVHIDVDIGNATSQFASMAWHGMAWYGMAWHGMAWHGSKYGWVMVLPSNTHCDYFIHPIETHHPTRHASHLFPSHPIAV
jgi:hypothetical protein